jgi:peptidoglycan hydrolase-like protein with peptidoglycan-binding domain
MQGEQANAPNGPGQAPGPGGQAEQQANAPQGQEAPGQQGGMQQGPPPDAIRAEIGTPVTEAALGLNRPDLKEIQRRLNVLGLYDGGIDGDFGPGTRGAIAEWQRREGAQPTGMLGPIQLQALRAQSGPVVGQRADGGNCPTGFHAGPYGRRCWPNR